jgi:cohesin complex subunit SCC1
LISCYRTSIGELLVNYRYDFLITPKRDIDFEDREIQPQGHHMARQADITLATADDLQFGVDDGGYGFDLGPSDGIGSQDYEVDLGLTFGDEPATPRERSEGDDMSVEVGRDAAPPRAARESLDSHLLGKGGDEPEMLSHHSRAPSEHPFGNDMDFGFGPEEGLNIDLDLDFGDRPISEGGKTPEQTRSPSRACMYRFCSETFSDICPSFSAQ